MSESATPTTRRRETTRQRLLDAAAQVFAEVGLDAASVEAVCERAGFTRGAFYSNFDSKNELFLELSARVARERVDAVTARVAALEEEGAFDVVPGAAVQLVQQVMDVSSDDRLGVLLMAEIRMHALRDPQLAAAYLAQEAEVLVSIAQIIEDISRAKGLELRLPADEAARIMMTVFESCSVRAVMAGADADEMRRRTSGELGRATALIIVPRHSGH
jgi:AcrR family transcriptional regulator